MGFVLLNPSGAFADLLFPPDRDIGKQKGHLFRDVSGTP